MPVTAVFLSMKTAQGPPCLAYALGLISSIYVSFTLFFSFWSYIHPPYVWKSLINEVELIFEFVFENEETNVQS